MSVTYGFYNALNHDRHYDSTQMSTLFDGIINDGMFQSIGTCMIVKATTGNIVSVGIGRAWFNHTWTWNDAILPITADLPEVILDRIDAVVLEVNATEAVRANDIKIIKGTPASEPVRPTLVNSVDVHQHPLCYIYRKAKATEITQADITNMVGSEDCPFVTGILKTVSMSELLGQWEDRLDQFIASEESDYTTWWNSMKADLDAERLALTQWETDQKNNMNTWTASEETAFLTWFDSIKGKLSTDQAGNLQNEIDENTYEDLLSMHSMVNKTTTFNKDAETGKTMSIDELADDRWWNKKTTFNRDTETGKVSTIDEIYNDKNYILTKKTAFNSDGSIKETFTKAAQKLFAMLTMSKDWAIIGDNVGISFTGTGYGTGSGYQYKFEHITEATGLNSVDKDYGTSNIYATGFTTYLGDRIFTLTVKDNLGNMASCTKRVHVLPKLTASLIVTPTNAKVGSIFELTATASGGSNSGYQYKFEIDGSTAGDTNYATLQDFSATASWRDKLTTAGTRHVRVTVKDSLGNTATSNVTVTVTA